MIDYKIRRDFLLPKELLLVGVRSANNVKTGLSTMFEALIEGIKESALSYDVVDLQNRSDGAIGSFNFTRAFNIFQAILACWTKIPFSNCVYLILSLSTFGFIRDLLIIWPTYIFKKRMIVHVRGGGYDVFYSAQTKFMQFLIRKTLVHVKTIIVLSESLRNQFDFAQPLRDKTMVVPNGIKKARLHSVYSKQYRPFETFRILYLSNLIESKGYFDLLKACHFLIQAGITDFRCDFCGDFLSLAGESNSTTLNTQKSSFLKCIKDWHLQDLVFYHGSVTGNDKQEILLRSHVLILPTNYLWEGQPVSILEALSYGSPVISTAYRAIPDMVNHEKNGLFVDFGAPDQICAAITKLKTDPVFYMELSKNALTTYENNFTLDMHIDKMLSILFDKNGQINL